MHLKSAHYDLAIAYRIYPKVSKIPAIFPDDKYKLSQVCLRSLKDSLGSLKVKIWVLLDNCPSEYEGLFRKYFDEADLEFVRLDGVGNQTTFEMQIKILSEQTDSELVYFAEDDYLYLPDQFEKMIGFMNSCPDVDFISPYDHLDYYTLDLHNHSNQIRVANNHHWRTASSTCLTFLARKESLRQAKTAFMSFTKGSFDASLWISLTKIRVFNISLIYQYRLDNQFLYDVLSKSWRYTWQQILFGRKFTLWTPIPSIATHADKAFLAPNIHWDDLIKSYT